MAYASRSKDATEDDEPARRGAGDQSPMFGYATDETPSLMPLPIDPAERTGRTDALRRAVETG